LDFHARAHGEIRSNVRTEGSVIPGKACRIRADEERSLFNISVTAAK